MAHSKVVLATGEVLMDLTGDTVEKENLLKGYKAHGADGELIEGSCTFDVDSSAIGTKPAEVLSGKLFAAGGEVKTGTMPNRGGASGAISTKDGTYTIQQGYHDGSGKVGIDPTEKGKLIPGNIRQGVTILGVEGDMSGSEDVKAQAKTATPTFAEQTILPDSGYTHLTQVKIEAIPVTYADNASGGTTVTIG